MKKAGCHRRIFYMDRSLVIDSWKRLANWKKGAIREGVRGDTQIFRRWEQPGEGRVRSPDGRGAGYQDLDQADPQL